MTREDRKPNWNVWAHVPRVRVWEAVALSLDIDPKRIKRPPHAWMAGGGNFPQAEGQAFEDRIEVLRRNLGDKSGLRLGAIVAGEPDNCEIFVADFARWTLSLNWKIPAELEALAGKAPAPKPTAPLQPPPKETALSNEELIARLTKYLEESEKGFPSQEHAIVWAAEVTPLLKYNPALHTEFRYRAQHVSNSSLSGTFQGNNMNRMRALIAEAAVELETNVNSPPAQAEVAIQERSLAAPEKLTLGWLWNHVPLAWWASLGAVLLAVFGFGVSVGQSEFYSRITTSAKQTPGVVTAPDSKKVVGPEVKIAPVTEPKKEVAPEPKQESKATSG